MTDPLYFEVPDYEDTRYTFERLCQDIQRNIFLADTVFLPNSFALAPHQQAIFWEYETHKFCFCQICRSAAKTYTTARYILLKCLTNEITVILTAPTFRQSLLTFNFIIQMIKENSAPDNKIKLSKEIDGKIISGGMEARIRFKNGSIIKALPMGQGDKIRGERADILYCDEFFKMDKEMFKVHLLPFLSKPIIMDKRTGKPTRMESKLILTTSAEYEDCFAYHFLTKTMLPKVKEEAEKLRADPTFKPKFTVIDFNIDDLEALRFPLEPDIVALQISEANHDEKQRVLYNKWIGLSGQFFGRNLVETLERDYIHVETEAEPNYTYIATVDVAFSPEGDDFVLNTCKMLGNRKMALVNSFFKKGFTQDEIALTIHEFDSKFNYRWIYMDKGGGGYAVASSLSKRKVILPDNRVVNVDAPILLHDEFLLSGKKKLILNKPSDSLVRQSFSGERSRSGEEISTEDILLHFTYTGIKNLIVKEDPDILIPKSASEMGDNYARSEMAILDNIRECLYQMRLLTVKTEANPDGTREIIRAKTSKVPLYIWKRGKKDGAVNFCYGIVPYLLYYKDEFGEVQEREPAFIVQPNEYSEFSWLYHIKEDPTQIQKQAV